MKTLNVGCNAGSVLYHLYGVTNRNCSHPLLSNRPLHVWDPVQHCACHRCIHHLPGLSVAAAARGLGPKSAAAARNAERQEQATRWHKRRTQWNPAHPSQWGQKLQLQTSSLTLSCCSFHAIGQTLHSRPLRSILLAMVESTWKTRHTFSRMAWPIWSSCWVRNTVAEHIQEKGRQCNTGVTFLSVKRA